MPNPKLGSQYLVSCYFSDEDYHTLSSYAELRFGRRKMAAVIRLAVKQYMDRAGVPFDGKDPKGYGHES